MVLSVFIAGLMVGRTPEYLGKKIESYDVKMSMLYVLIFPLVILMLTAISFSRPRFGTSNLNNAGPTWAVGDSLRLYFRRGKQRLGLRRYFGEHMLVQHMLGWHMLFGRFLMIIPMLAVAGNLADEEDSCRLRWERFP